MTLWLSKHSEVVVIIEISRMTAFKDLVPFRTCLSTGSYMSVYIQVYIYYILLIINNNLAIIRL
jgi:hypothetical protein